MYHSRMSDLLNPRSRAHTRNILPDDLYRNFRKESEQLTEISKRDWTRFVRTTTFHLNVPDGCT